MADLNLEALEKRVRDLERRLNQRDTSLANDWRAVAGMFTGSEFSKQVDEEARRIREADREAARLELGE